MENRQDKLREILENYVENWDASTGLITPHTDKAIAEIRKLYPIVVQRDKTGTLGEELIEYNLKAYEELKEENKRLKEAEKELSDAYLRIRELVGAWDTNKGGENRFKVTEDKIKRLKESRLTESEILDVLDKFRGYKILNPSTAKAIISARDKKGE